MNAIYLEVIGRLGAVAMREVLLRAANEWRGPSTLTKDDLMRCVFDLERALEQSDPRSDPSLSRIEMAIFAATYTQIVEHGDGPAHLGERYWRDQLVDDRCTPTEATQATRQTRRHALEMAAGEIVEYRLLTRPDEPLPEIQDIIGWASGRLG